MEHLKNINLAEQEPQETLSMDPKKFILWLFIVSIIMLFASQTSAYLVRRAEGNWLEFTVPVIFSYSTVVLVLSSISRSRATEARNCSTLCSLSGTASCVEPGSSRVNRSRSDAMTIGFPGSRAMLFLDT